MTDALFKRRWRIIFLNKGQEVVVDLSSYKEDLGIIVKCTPYLTFGWPIYNDIQLFNLSLAIRNTLFSYKELTVKVFASYQGEKSENEPLSDGLIFNGQVIVPVSRQLFTPDYVDHFYCMTLNALIVPKYHEAHSIQLPAGSLHSQLQVLCQKYSPNLQVNSVSFPSLSNSRSSLLVEGHDFYQMMRTYSIQHSACPIIDTLLDTAYLTPLRFSEEDREQLNHFSQETEMPYISGESGLVGWPEVDASTGLVHFTMRLHPTIRYNSHIKLDLSNSIVTSLHAVSAPGQFTREWTNKLQKWHNLTILGIEYNLTSRGKNWSMKCVGISVELLGH